MLTGRGSGVVDLGLCVAFALGLRVDFFLGFEAIFFSGFGVDVNADGVVNRLSSCCQDIFS